MSKHNFKALQTFRGWSAKNKEWMYGFLTKEPKGLRLYISNDNFERVCVPESIGIYTGKDDKNGTPIFAGLPEDGNIGGDKLKTGHRIDGYFEGIAKYDTFGFVGYRNGKAQHIGFASTDLEVNGTQYEQHLKENK